MRIRSPRIFLQTRKKGRSHCRAVSYGTGFIDSADNIIFSTEPSVLENSQVFGGGNCWYGLGTGGTKWGELPMGGAEVQLPMSGPADTDV